MEKYYNSFDRVFLAHDPFKGELTDIDGNKLSGLIEDVSIMLAAMAVDKLTGQPKYSINKTEPHVYIENNIYNQFFHATIDSEIGVLIIPDADKIKEFEEKNQGLTVACKVVEYMIYLGDVKDTVFVPESEFNRIIKQNFNRFNNSDNYHGQCTSFSYHKVKKEYPREKRTNHIKINDYYRLFMIDQYDPIDDATILKDINDIINVLSEEDFDVTDWEIVEHPAPWVWCFYNDKKREAFDVYYFEEQQAWRPAYLYNYINYQAKSIKEAIEKFDMHGNSKKIDE